MSTNASNTIRQYITSNDAALKKTNDAINTKTADLKKGLDTQVSEFGRTKKALEDTDANLAGAIDIASKARDQMNAVSKSKFEKQTTFIEGEDTKLRTSVGVNKGLITANFNKVSVLNQSSSASDNAIIDSQARLKQELHHTINMTASNSKAGRVALNVQINDLNNKVEQNHNDSAKALAAAKQALDKQHTDELNKATAQHNASFVAHLGEISTLQGRAKTLETYVNGIVTEDLERHEKLLEGIDTSVRLRLRLCLVECVHVLCLPWCVC